MMRCISAIMLTVVGIFATSAQSIDVTYFHGKQRCVTCMSIERLTKEVLNKHYAKELKNGKLKFKIVDISTNNDDYISYDLLTLEKTDKVGGQNG